jgi:hypothetical protein
MESSKHRMSLKLMEGEGNDQINGPLVWFSSRWRSVGQRPHRCVMCGTWMTKALSVVMADTSVTKLARSMTAKS